MQSDHSQVEESSQIAIAMSFFDELKRRNVFKVASSIKNSLCGLGSNLAEKFIFRPGYIKPGPKHPNKTISAKAFEPFYRLFPAIGVDADVLAKAIVDVGIRGHERTILENRDLRMFTN
jgi:hypothetical protein